MAIIPSLADDPCGRLSKLLEIRDRIATGGMVVEAENEQGNGVRRRVKYSTADSSILESEIRLARDACNALSGCTRPGRFAIGGRMS